MRLRTRLSLAFAALAVLPLLLSAPLVARRLRTTFDEERARRAEASRALVAAEVEALRARVSEAVTAAAREPAAEELAHALDGAGPLPPPDAARSLSEGRGLSVLGLVDAAGRVRSSAHFPARTGDVDPGLAAVLSAPPGAVVVSDVQVHAPEGPRAWPALLAARPVEEAPGTWVVGGVLLDAELAAHLSRLSGAEVEVQEGTEVLASAGTAGGRAVSRDIPLGAATGLVVRVGGAAAAEAELALGAGLAAALGAGLLLAVALGLLLARRITGPLEALTRGAQAVAAGALDTHVQARAQGEVGVLVEAFNRMTAELGRTTRALVEAERVAAWEEVARGLAHELKNPLTPLQMSLETLVAAQEASSPRFAELFRESAPAMREEVERLKRTVDAFARFARLPPPLTASLDVGAWAEQSLQLYGGVPGLQLETHLLPGLHVLADRDQLAQVLHNLLKNAEEATAGAPPWVAVRVYGAGDSVVLEVEDGGPGISPEERERIFEPAFSRKPGGSGLGLAIARRIAVEHGGRLEVGRGARGGALFQLKLPRAP
jgi:two-component system, NtrC family, nitrogen regulation sensor histidine kinase NtrY